MAEAAQQIDDEAAAEAKARGDTGMQAATRAGSMLRKRAERERKARELRDEQKNLSEGSDRSDA
jgi:hypothetical protein